MFTKSCLLFAMIFARKSEADVLRATRQLSNELIAGYEPSSVVTDHNALDLDQKAMEAQLDSYTDAGFAVAQNIYERGGHSKTFAVLNLEAPLGAAVSEGTVITGSNEGGDVVTGEAYADAAAGESVLKFRYAVGSSQATYSGCQVGGLLETNTAGCLVSNGTIAVGSDAAIRYSYPVGTGNQNGRTLQFFSISANERMRVDGKGDFYEDFAKFNKYYGAVDYSDKIVQAAFGASSASLNGKTFDFSSYALEPRAEVIAKTSAYLGVAMYVLRELEDALDDCAANDPTRNADQVLALDEAVAFYTGSLEGTTGTGEGVFIYSLANKRCVNFKTCGSNGDQIEGNAKVNIDIFTEFNKMKENLAAGSNCAEARKNKEAIAKKLFVPMIQGTLRYAYKQSQADTDAVAEAEGAIFAAAVLPIVDACNSGAAATIFEEMMPNSGNTADFSAVKSSFEKTYSCMGITCADVGGVYDSATQSYSEGASPCGGSGSSDDSKVGLAIGLSVGAVVLLVLLVLLMKRRGKSSVEFKSEGTSHV